MSMPEESRRATHPPRPAFAPRARHPRAGATSGVDAHALPICSGTGPSRRRRARRPGRVAGSSWTSGSSRWSRACSSPARCPATVTGECVRCLDPVTVRSWSTCRSSTPTRGPRGQEPDEDDDTSRAGDRRVTCSTSSRRCGTRWCSPCRCGRCAGTTARVCAPSAGPGSRTTRSHAHEAVDPRWAALRPGSRAGARPQQLTDQHDRHAPPTSPRTTERGESHRGRSQAEDVAQQHALAPGELEGRPPLPWWPAPRCREPQAGAHGVPHLRHLQRPRRPRRLSR